ncbi:hypothetical protein A8C56_05630 [Niabella ginsenosidivorans]|uniref:DoxX family protein n=1 Tax=Niabella ginsenosidivorans TaxID=1176587 RepID=A0A1A9IAL7_9BACT|nr:hypothetical protein [Niabella ginsenosidivorans]ANH83721.1 hypothetical protein A8C56_05630 [Niabella ginsenosidivorans]
MKPFLILIIAFILSLLVIRLVSGVYDYSLAGRIAMAVMLLFTGIAHFAKPKEMALMLPKAIPGRILLILLTGILEIAAAAGLLFTQTCILTGWMLICFFLVILPANIYAAVSREGGARTTFTGQGVKYLWFRIPLQLFFIIWTYVFAVMGPA